MSGWSGRLQGGSSFFLSVSFLFSKPYMQVGQIKNPSIVSLSFHPLGLPGPPSLSPEGQHLSPDVLCTHIYIPCMSSETVHMGQLALPIVLHLAFVRSSPWETLSHTLSSSWLHDILQGGRTLSYLTWVWRHFLACRAGRYTSNLIGRWVCL